MEKKEGKRVKFAIVLVLSFSITTIFLNLMGVNTNGEVYSLYADTMKWVAIAFLGLQSYTDFKKGDKNV